ncbi:MAG: hypothetical protein KVP17_004228 [Porospora cf. gigantea B]|uniref:uncharacterized protein n=1 Tax=Porospora cf. gigantea B TaxID=2853592 RepID=UPI003571965B|nr:MAG: hypothetical protein KVP17_004228 [Porospora cf. gigantea B]
MRLAVWWVLAQGTRSLHDYGLDLQGLTDEMPNHGTETTDCGGVMQDELKHPTAQDMQFVALVGALILMLGAVVVVDAVRHRTLARRKIENEDLFFEGV